jgi:hypothetical protein
MDFNKKINEYSSDIKYNINFNKNDLFLQKINSIIDGKIEDFFLRLNNKNFPLFDENINNINNINNYLDQFNNINIITNSTLVLETNNDKINNIIKKDIGVDFDLFEKYLNNYKKSAEKYFFNILKIEKNLYLKIQRFYEYKEFCNKLETFNKNENENLYLEDTIKNYNKYINNICDLDELNKELDNYNLNKECFLKIIKLIPDINNIGILPKCIICMNNIVNKILLPCCHTCCDNCLQQIIQISLNSRINIIKCPICRKYVNNNKNIYYS